MGSSDWFGGINLARCKHCGCPYEAHDEEFGICFVERCVCPGYEEQKEQHERKDTA